MHEQPLLALSMLEVDSRVPAFRVIRGQRASFQSTKRVDANTPH